MKKRIKTTESVAANEPKNSFVFTMRFITIPWQRDSTKLFHNPVDH